MPKWLQKHNESTLNKWHGSDMTIYAPSRSDNINTEQLSSACQNV